MPDIKLNFVNDSNDKNNSQIVIFQNNESFPFGDAVVAWTVIQNCGAGWNHPFSYPMKNTIAAGDSWGNFSPQLTADNGQRFSIIEDTSGDILKLTGESTDLKEIEVLNALERGAVSANIYKDGKLLAIKTDIAPGQKAVFQFKPTIWIGVASQVQEGEIVNSAVVSQINTEISLLGLKSADIVMRGGGPGHEAAPYTFSLENIVYA
ncbi:hypothetical protein [Filimonas effusa]|uniref:Aromatic ring-opening dioxygenase LigA n=1 Tax=Filimonas effusa TaxID=2508721 RepID=A0A4Q1DBR8_9BACT|nr:hypothetical protein [Filimonas effusa]RXK86887.1 hypothetical protein ESB13_08885 [Filimonas effusa]